MDVVLYSGKYDKSNKDLYIMDDIKIRRLRWARHIIITEDERIPPKKFFMESVKIQDLLEKQEKNGSSLSGGTYHRS